MKNFNLINLLFISLIFIAFTSCSSGGRDGCIKGMMADGMTYEEAADACDDFNTNSNNRE